MSVGSQLDTSGSTSHTLLQRVQQHDPIAWQRFSQLYTPLVYRWCVTNGLQSHDAADVVQEVFQAVFQGIARFQRHAAGQSFRGWLWTVTRNKVCDFFRRRQEQPAVSNQTLTFIEQAIDMPESISEPAERTLAELAHRALQLIQTDFEPRTWQAFLAVVVEGQSVQETATKLGLSTAAVYKAKSRVLNRLRQELDGLLE